MIKRISVKEVEQITYSFAKKTMEWNQPVPDFRTRLPNRLESCLATPFSSFSKKDLYPTFLDKAAILFYLLSKNHSFQNGNKRVAVVTLIYFLFINGLKTKIPPDNLFQLSILVSESPSEIKDAVLQAIKIILKKYTQKLSNFAS